MGAFLDFLKAVQGRLVSENMYQVRKESTNLPICEECIENKNATN